MGSSESDEIILDFFQKIDLEGRSGGMCLSHFEMERVRFGFDFFYDRCQ